MKFAFVALYGTVQPDGRHQYQSQILKHENRPSLEGHKSFESEDEMLRVMDDILRSQPNGADRDVRRVMHGIQSPGGHQWTGTDSLDLTDAQAAALGWKG